MAESEGNGKSYEKMQELDPVMDTRMWKSLGNKAESIGDPKRRELAKHVLDSESVEEVAEKIYAIHRGTLLDNLILAGAAVGGMLAGYKVQGSVDLRVGGAPVPGLLGLVGVGAGAVLDTSLTARNAVSLGGMLFLAGAGLYKSTHPIEGDAEEA